MNADVPPVAPAGILLPPETAPFMHLAGITSLTPILSELPTPSPSRGVLDAMLCCLPKQANVLQAVNDTLNSEDEQLVAVLAQALSRNNTMNAIALKEPYCRYPENIDPSTLSPLAQAILRRVPDVFSTAVINSCAINPPTLCDPANSPPPSQETSVHNQSANDLSSQLAPPSNSSVGSAEPSTPGSACAPSESDKQNVQAHLPIQNAQLRRQIVSVGKQPKAQISRKKKDLVSELFDSLTPDPQYFADTHRRRRKQPQTYNDETFEKPSIASLGKESPREVSDLPPPPPRIPSPVRDRSCTPKPCSSTIKEKKSKKRKRRDSDDSVHSRVDEMERPLTPQGVIDAREREWREMQKRRREKYIRRRDNLNNLTLEEMVEHENFTHFASVIDGIFDNMESQDVQQDDEDETIITKQVLDDLAVDARKLKALGATFKIPHEKLVKLLTILEKNIRDGQNMENPYTEAAMELEGEETFRELVAERVLRSAEASLIALLIMTSPNMPKQVYIEDVIERIVRLLKDQLTRIIYPAYDLLYTAGQELKTSPEKGKKEPASEKKKKGGKSGKKKSSQKRDKTLQNLYAYVSETIMYLAELVEMQPLTDTQISCLHTVAISPFFVDNIKEVQLNSLRLAATIFGKYPRHRDQILNEVVASLHRLPTGKAIKQTYRLMDNKYIQMVSALVMQLVQATVQMPSSREALDWGDIELSEDGTVKHTKKPAMLPQDADIIVLRSHDDSVRVATIFMKQFLSKCGKINKECSGGESVDHRPLFSLFLVDILAALHKPAWPAAELLLNLLGKLLVQYISGGRLNKNTDINFRQACLDYLGIVTATLRRDSLGVDNNEDDLKAIVNILVGNDPDDDEDPSEDRRQVLMRGLCDYLLKQVESEPTVHYALVFNLVQWYKDAETEKSRVMKGEDPTSTYITPLKMRIKRSELTSNNKSIKTNSDLSEVVKPVSINLMPLEEDAKLMNEFKESFTPVKSKKPSNESVSTVTVTEHEQRSAAIMATTACKSFLLSLVDRDYELQQHSIRNTDTWAETNSEDTLISESQAIAIVRYLASRRPFSQSFDILLGQILRVLNEQSEKMRSKALKCLSDVVSVDPNILNRSDVERGVRERLRDQATNVREAGLTLIGSYVMNDISLVEQYYPILKEKILDVGQAVRKRVIRILKEICEKYTVSRFSKVPEICVLISRRIADEEGIKKLVTETFTTLWFSPMYGHMKAKLYSKLDTIIEVIAAARESHSEDAIEKLFENILKNQKGQPEKAAEQIVDCIVERMLQLDGKIVYNDASVASTEEDKKTVMEMNDRTKKCILINLTCLRLLSSVKPELVTKHAETLQPYLSSSNLGRSPTIEAVRNATDTQIQVIQILEKVVPLQQFPAEAFLERVEDALRKLILSGKPNTIQPAVACLSAINVRHRKNDVGKIRDVFIKLYSKLITWRESHMGPQTQVHVSKTDENLLNRAIFTIGFLARYFDFDLEYESMESKPEDTWNQRIYDELVKYMQFDNFYLQALRALGQMCATRQQFFDGRELKDHYQHKLRSNIFSRRGTPVEVKAVEMLVNVKTIILRNIELFLIEEERRMGKSYALWQANKDQENLKDLGDIQSGTGSVVIQKFISDVYRCYYTHYECVRVACADVISCTLTQGLVTPVHTVPTLIAMSTDYKASIRIKAKQLLDDFKARFAQHSGGIASKLNLGVTCAFRLHKAIEEKGGEPNDLTVVRGLRTADIDDNDSSGEVKGDEKAMNTEAHLAYLYKLIKGNKSQRRLMITNLLKAFKESEKQTLPEMIYIADNLASLPYQYLDEPMYVIHEADQICNITGANVIQSFKEALQEKRNSQSGILMPEDDEDSAEMIYERLPLDLTPLYRCIDGSMGCFLLLYLKNHLKTLYGISDNKLNEYQPTDSTKTWERQLTRRGAPFFSPSHPLLECKPEVFKMRNSEEGKKRLCQQFIQFRDFMLAMDKTDGDSDSDDNAEQCEPPPTPAKHDNNVGVQYQQQYQAPQQQQPYYEQQYYQPEPSQMAYQAGPYYQQPQQYQQQPYYPQQYQ